MIVTPFEVYQTYLAFKNHFTKPSYDFYKYNGKTRASLKSFYGRKDRYFFEKLSRQKNDDEIKKFFVSNFVSCSNPQCLWIGDIIKNGESVYKEWLRNTQSLSYKFQSEIKPLISEYGLKDLFKITNHKHSIILKKYYRNEVSLETLVILNKLYHYIDYYDQRLSDPVWEFTSLRIKKYSNFLTIEEDNFRKIVVACINS